MNKRAKAVMIILYYLIWNVGLLRCLLYVYVFVCFKIQSKIKLENEKFLKGPFDRIAWMLG